MSQQLEEAVSILRGGGIVAFPTETVYGLGADATNAAAVQRVFDVKGRPPTNPCIVHVADAQIARRFTSHWPDMATKLVERFWPGPLTLVLPKTDAIVPAVTAGLATVGLRSPNHTLTLELLRRFDGPLIGPSANRSTHLSPTTAQHVRDELGDTVDLILDGGPCRVGIESTVLDLSTALPTILRPGAVSPQQIEAIIGPVQMQSVLADPSTAARSPGQYPVHYAPITPTYRFDDKPPVSVKQANFGFMLLGDAPQLIRLGGGVVQMPNVPDEYARLLYSTLRELDGMGLDAIYIEMPPDEPQWLAVRDRLRRASRPAPPWTFTGRFCPLL